MSSEPTSDAERERARRLRAARLLGDLVPDATADDTDEGWGEREPSRDDELKRNVPPHHS